MNNVVHSAVNKHYPAWVRFDSYHHGYSMGLGTPRAYAMPVYMANRERGLTPYPFLDEEYQHTTSYEPTERYMRETDDYGHKR